MLNESIILFYLLLHPIFQCRFKLVPHELRNYVVRCFLQGVFATRYDNSIGIYIKRAEKLLTFLSWLHTISISKLLSCDPESVNFIGLYLDHYNSEYNIVFGDISF